MSPKVSVIIPVYNMERYLCECLDSVLNQTLKEIETICINDGSTDKSLEILNEYAQKDNRIIIISQENCGVAVARNLGLKTAHGEFVCFMDPDDLYPNSEILELLYAKAVENNVNICGGSFSDFRDGEVNTNYSGDYADYTFENNGLIDYRDYQFDYGYHRFLYNREMVISNNLFFPLYKRYQDPPFFVQAMLVAKCFYAIKDVTYRYRTGHQDTLDKWPLEKVHDMLRGMLDNIRIAKANNLTKLYAFTTKRLVDPWFFDRLMKRITEFDYESHRTLMEICKEIDYEFLQPSFQDMIAYQLLARQQSESLMELYEFQQKKFSQLDIKLSETEKHLNDVKTGLSFKIGRIITWIPRKLLGRK